MMKFVARYLLWILIAVLPMQGSAAAWMVLGGGKATAVANGSHCDQAAKAVAATDDAASAAGAVGGKGGNGHSKCGSCASCCLGASAPPLEPLQALPHPQINDAMAEPEPAKTAFISSAPERPPRAHT